MKLECGRKAIDTFFVVLASFSFCLSILNLAVQDVLNSALWVEVVLKK